MGGGSAILHKINLRKIPFQLSYLANSVNRMKIPAFLIVLLLCAAGAHAASTNLYETGWEASPPPPSPAWVTGAVAPQNGWSSAGTSTLRHRVLANGSADANPFGTAVTTPYGSQFHR